MRPSPRADNGVARMTEPDREHLRRAVAPVIGRPVAPHMLRGRGGRERLAAGAMSNQGTVDPRGPKAK